MAKHIQFYEDEAKTNLVYPEIDPNGIYPGVTVGLADNFTVPVDEENAQSVTFNFRSTGGDADVTEGSYATLANLKGALSTDTISESLHYNLLGTGVSSIDITQSTFKAKIGNTKGTYNFIYTPVISCAETKVNINNVIFARYVSMATGNYIFSEEAAMTYSDPSSFVMSLNTNTFGRQAGGEPNVYSFIYEEGNGWTVSVPNKEPQYINPISYGITIDPSKTPQNNDTFVVSYTANQWKIGVDVVSLAAYGIVETGTLLPGDSFTVNYTANEWQLDGVAATLSQYGIVITGGGPQINNTIQVIFQPEEIGRVQVANPTAILSKSLNAFNKNGDQIIEGYTIAADGTMTSSQGSYVIYFRNVADLTYVIYDSVANSVIRVAYSERPVASYTTGMTVLTPVTSVTPGGRSVVNNTTTSYYTPTDEGYLAVATTDIENLCCHLAWTKSAMDTVYEEYWEYTLPIPYKDNNGNTISTYGLPYLSSTMCDEIDFIHLRYIKRITRIDYSPSALATVQSTCDPGEYAYDDDYIYYYNENNIKTYNLLEENYKYKISDYGTEEFVGTNFAIPATILYSPNLKDKLRRSVEVLDNKKDVIGDYENSNDYPSMTSLYKTANLIWNMLGLSRDTFDSTTVYSNGDYIVYNHELYKCVADQSLPGELPNGAASSASLNSDPNSIITTITGSTFLTNYGSFGVGDYLVKVSNYTTSGGTPEVRYELYDPNGTRISTYPQGIVFSGAIGQAIIRVTNSGNWIKSYIFKA